MKRILPGVVLCGLLIAGLVGAETYYTHTAIGQYFVCRLDGVQVSQHTTERKANEVAGNLKLSNPDSSVICVHEYQVVTLLTAAGKVLVNPPAAPVCPTCPVDPPVDPGPPVDPPVDPDTPVAPPVDPPTASCSSPYRGIPDPCAALGFDVYADYAIDRVISGTQSGNFSISGNGTAADPYFVDASSATFNVGTGRLSITGEYVVFVGGTINSTGESPLSAKASNSVYRDIDIGGNNTDQGFGSSIFPASNTVFVDVAVHDFGVIQTSKEQDQHGWKIQARNVWILDSQGYNLSGDGVQCGDASRGRCDDVYIGGGNYYDNRENGVDIKDSRNVVVSGVTMSGFAGTSSDPGAAIVIHDDAFDAKIYDNVISNARIGIVTSGESGHEITNNTIQATFRGIECRNTRNLTISGNDITAPTEIERQSNCSGAIQ